MSSLHRPAHLRRAAVACATFALLAPAVATADPIEPEVPAPEGGTRAYSEIWRLKNNVESPLYRYGSCSFRVQAGQFGDAAYGQLKVRNSYCVRTGPNRSDFMGSTYPYNTFSAIGAVGYVGSGGQTGSANTPLPGPGPREIQATVRPAFAWSGTFSVCVKATSQHTAGCFQRRYVIAF